MRNAGFSLVEVSLALLVIAVGILSVLSLFPLGLDQSARSVGDSHAALFAEEVFSGLRVQAETDWDNLGVSPVVCAASGMWGDPVPLNRVETGADDVATNIYEYGDYEDHAFRYRMTIDTNERTTVKSAMLRVWPGEYGSLSNPVVFYTEFYRFK